MFYVHVHMSKIITYDRNAGIVLGGRKMIFIVDAALFVTTLRVGVSCNSPFISWGYLTRSAHKPRSKQLQYRLGFTETLTTRQIGFLNCLMDIVKVIYSNLKGALKRNA